MLNHNHSLCVCVVSMLVILFACALGASAQDDKDKTKAKQLPEACSENQVARFKLTDPNTGEPMEGWFCAEAIPETCGEGEIAVFSSDAGWDCQSYIENTVDFDGLLADVSTNAVGVSGNRSLLDAQDARMFALEQRILELEQEPDGPCYNYEDRYVDCGNGTVTDADTGLIWLANAQCFPALDWVSAHDAVASLSAPDCGLADNSKPGDWRMPTVEEWEATMKDARDRLFCTFQQGPAFTDRTGTGCIEDDPNPVFNLRPETDGENYWAANGRSITTLRPDAMFDVPSAAFASLFFGRINGVGAVEDFWKGRTEQIRVWAVRSVTFSSSEPF